VKNLGITARVRGAARRLRVFGSDDIGSELGIQTYADARRVRTTINDLRKTGEIECVDRGRYRYVARGTSAVRSRVCRAMHVKGVFSAREIAMLSDADGSYVRHIIRDLIASGDLEKAGLGESSKGRLESRYRVSHIDKFYKKIVMEMEPRIRTNNTNNICVNS